MANNFETAQRQARHAEIRVTRGEHVSDTDNFGAGVKPLPGEEETGIISSKQRVINTVLLALTAATGSALALHFLNQPAEASQSAIIPDAPAALNCDFQVLPAPDHRSSQISGIVPVSELLDRGTKTFDVIAARKWTFCASGANGAVYVTRVENDEGKAITKTGDVIHIEHLSISELNTPPSKRSEEMIWGMGSCDAKIQGQNAKIDCTLPRNW